MPSRPYPSGPGSLFGEGKIPLTEKTGDRGQKKTGDRGQGTEDRGQGTGNSKN